MSTTGQLLWASKMPDKACQCILILDPVLGLSDLDFHPVAEQHWERLKNPGGVAQLLVAPTVSIQKVQQALEMLKNKGEFAEIMVDVQKSESS